MHSMPKTTDDRKQLWISREDANALVEFFCIAVMEVERLKPLPDIHTTYRTMLDRIGGLLGQLNLRLSPESIERITRNALAALIEAGVEVVH